MVDRISVTNQAKESQPVHVAHYDDWPLNITLGNDRQQPITGIGEILAAGYLDENQQFVIEDIQRIVLQSQERIDELGGAISIAGPINQPRVRADFKGDIKEFDVWVYYPRLSSELKPACVESDATYPYMEKLRGTLTWEPLLAEGLSPRSTITLTLSEPLVSYLDAVRPKDISSLPWDFSFQPPSDQPYSSPKANSLSACTDPLTLGGQNDPKVKELKVHFWAADNLTVDPALKLRVQGWIDKACEVWYKKGGLNIIPFGTIDSKPKEDIPTDRGQNANGDPDAIDIYLTKVSPTGSNGGQSFDCGTPDGCIVLDVNKILPNNVYVLAHEIGHILGLYHPGDCDPCTDRRQGSLRSVMVPSFPIERRNTRNNLEAIDGLESVLGPRVLTSTNSSCIRSPDANILDPVIQNLWNSERDLSANFNDLDSNRQRYTNNAKVFNPNNMPTHANPVNVGDTNYMCIRLCDCLRARPVRIFFYIGSTQTNPRVNLLTVINHAGNGPQLLFPATRAEETTQSWFDLRKRTRSVSWTVPNGWQNSWIFAIEVPLAVGNVPVATLTNIDTFVQMDSNDPAALEALMIQHPNVIGYRLIPL